MLALRRIAVKNAPFFNKVYDLLETSLIKLHPVFDAIGYERIEKPITFVERNVKGLLFDCKMCGQCVLHDTGMSCPMNCPKELRNGPCGGVRPNGNCEVKPDMPCVWVEAWKGNQILGNQTISVIQLPLDRRLQGQSSWLREAQSKRQQQEASS